MTISKERTVINMKPIMKAVASTTAVDRMIMVVAEVC